MRNELTCALSRGNDLDVFLLVCYHCYHKMFHSSKRKTIDELKGVKTIENQAAI